MDKLGTEAAGWLVGVAQWRHELHIQTYCHHLTHNSGHAETGSTIGSDMRTSIKPSVAGSVRVLEGAVQCMIVIRAEGACHAMCFKEATTGAQQHALELDPARCLHCRLPQTLRGVLLPDRSNFIQRHVFRVAEYLSDARGYARAW